MTNDTQYGRPVFIEDFNTGTSAKTLSRIRLEKSASENAAHDEAWLQRLIMNQPSLLPVDQIERAFVDLVPICMELSTPSGYLDNLLVNPAGDLALVECKLWRNPEARRQVVGQIIEYATEMSAWSYQDLQDAIKRTKHLDGSTREPSWTLYEEVSANGEIDEASFSDAVSRNLRRGRFLLLIVGDGIREGVERMAEFLQKYAGLHFTLAIVELALFELPEKGFIAQPRILAKTMNINRGIVTVDEKGRISIGPAPTAPLPTGTPGATMPITKELYLEKLERGIPGIAQKLNRFLDDLETYDVVPDFGADSMILRWHSDGTRSWNLGWITTAGRVYTDAFGHQAYSAGVFDAHKQYVEKLAALAPGAIPRLSKKQTAWGAYKDGRTITIDALLADEAREHGWLQAIEEFQAAVTKALPNE